VDHRTAPGSERELLPLYAVVIREVGPRDRELALSLEAARLSVLFINPQLAAGFEAHADRLREGIGVAELCGATPLVERARRELQASGGRVPPRTGGSHDQLTPSEQRIAELAASGLSNPEIAQRLFVTIKTVEMHLSNAYRKLDIASRHQLERALSRS
jgi:DNA-binding NarL/FixJ family response regulator